MQGPQGSTAHNSPNLGALHIPVRQACDLHFRQLARWHLLAWVNAERSAPTRRRGYDLTAVGGASADKTASKRLLTDTKGIAERLVAMNEARLFAQSGCDGAQS